MNTTARRTLAGLALVAGVACALTSPAAGQTPPAGAAQESFRTVADPNGRFTIGLPDGWSVTSMDTTAKQLVAGATAGKIPGAVTMSMLLGTAPAESGTLPASVVVLTMKLGDGASPAAVIQRLRESGVNADAGAAAGVRIIKAGPAQVAGRDAYYIYQTVSSRKPELYQIMVLVPGEHALMILLGQTPNELGRVRRDMPLIVNIINTFRLS